MLQRAGSAQPAYPEVAETQRGYSRRCCRSAQEAPRPHAVRHRARLANGRSDTRHRAWHRRPSSRLDRCRGRRLRSPMGARHARAHGVHAPASHRPARGKDCEHGVGRHRTARPGHRACQGARRWAALAHARPADLFRRGVLAARLRELHAARDCRSRIASGLFTRRSAALASAQPEREVARNGRVLAKDNGSGTALVTVPELALAGDDAG